MRKVAGFTLLEVVIAMAIVAIALVSLMEATGTYVKNTSFLKDKLIAQWVASNALNEMLLKEAFPAKGDKSGSEEMAGKQWKWTAEIKETADTGFRALEVKAFKGESDKSLATLITYVSEASVMCEKLNPQQDSCRPANSNAGALPPGSPNPNVP